MLKIYGITQNASSWAHVDTLAGSSEAPSHHSEGTKPFLRGTGFPLVRKIRGTPRGGLCHHAFLRRDAVDVHHGLPVFPHHIPSGEVLSSSGTVHPSLA